MNNATSILLYLLSIDRRMLVWFVCAWRTTERSQRRVEPTRTQTKQGGWEWRKRGSTHNVSTLSAKARNSWRTSSDNASASSLVCNNTIEPYTRTYTCVLTTSLNRYLHTHTTYRFAKRLVALRGWQHAAATWSMRIHAQYGVYTVYTSSLQRHSLVACVCVRYRHVSTHRLSGTCECDAVWQLRRSSPTRPSTIFQLVRPIYNIQFGFNVFCCCISRAFLPEDVCFLKIFRQKHCQLAPCLMPHR